MGCNNLITLDNKDISPRAIAECAALEVLCHLKRGITTGTRVDLFDEAFQLAHRVVYAHFLRYNGKLTSGSDLPAGSEIVSRAFAQSHPYQPIDQTKHM